MELDQKLYEACLKWYWNYGECGKTNKERDQWLVDKIKEIIKHEPLGNIFVKCPKCLSHTDTPNHELGCKIS